jgi:hypothetical protein
MRECTPLCTLALTVNKKSQVQPRRARDHHHHHHANTYWSNFRKNLVPVLIINIRTSPSTDHSITVRYCTDTVQCHGLSNL